MCSGGILVFTYWNLTHVWFSISDTTSDITSARWCSVQEGPMKEAFTCNKNNYLVNTSAPFFMHVCQHELWLKYWAQNKCTHTTLHYSHQGICCHIHMLEFFIHAICEEFTKHYKCMFNCSRNIPYTSRKFQSLNNLAVNLNTWDMPMTSQLRMGLTAKLNTEKVFTQTIFSKEVFLCMLIAMSLHSE